MKQFPEIIDKALSLFIKDGDDYCLRTQFYELQLYICQEDAESKYENVCSNIKKINRDIKNIATLLERLEWIHNEAQKNNEYLTRKWNAFTSLDIEHFYIDMRSIMDYATKILCDVMPNKGQMPNTSFEKLYNWVKKSPKNRAAVGDGLADIISSASWFSDIRGIRTAIIHSGSSPFVFQEPEEGILFQIYNENLKELVDSKSYIMYNDNVVHFDRYAVLYFSYLLFFLNDLSQAIVSFLTNKCSEQLSSYLKTIESHIVTKEIGETAFKQMRIIEHPDGFGLIQKWMVKLAQAANQSLQRTAGACP